MRGSLVLATPGRSVGRRVGGARSLAMLPAIAAVALAGCASPPAASLRETLTRVSTADAPSGYRLAIAPLAVVEAATLRGEADEAICPVPVDVDRLTGELAAAIGACRRFGDEVVVLPRVESTAPATPSSDASPAQASTADEEAPAGPTRIFAPTSPQRMQTTLDQAFAQNVDVLLRVKVTRQQVRFVEHNGWFFPNLVNLAVLVWPAYFGLS